MKTSISGMNHCPFSFSHGNAPHVTSPWASTHLNCEMFARSLSIIAGWITAICYSDYSLAFELIWIILYFYTWHQAKNSNGEGTGCTWGVGLNLQSSISLNHLSMWDQHVPWLMHSVIMNPRFWRNKTIIIMMDQIILGIVWCNTHKSTNAPGFSLTVKDMYIYFPSLWYLNPRAFRQHKLYKLSSFFFCSSSRILSTKNLFVASKQIAYPKTWHI